MASLHELFRKQAEKTPREIALVDGDRTLTYQELDRASDALAGDLVGRGVGMGGVVGIFMDKSIEFVVGYIGALKAGGAYMPLDAALPDGHLARILDEAVPRVILAKGAFADRITRLARDRAVLPLDTERNWRRSRLDPASVPRPDLDHPAYVVYSSGTTGEPKGIIAPHRGAVHSYRERYRISTYRPGDRVGVNVFFVWEVLRPLLKGAACHIIPDEIIQDPKPLLDFLEAGRITEVLFTPSLMETILNTVDGGTLQAKTAALETIWLNGEVVTRRLRDRILRRLPARIRVFNTYSISECHDVASVDLREPFDAEAGICPVGRPIDGVAIRLIDEAGKGVAPGGVGELLVGGPCLARGYLKKPELTAARFPIIDGDRFYRTGDLARFLPDGTLEIRGRCDFMVKMRGYSVHLGAVESAVLAHGDIKSCAVTAHGEEGGDKRLVAYLVRGEGARWTVDRRTGSCPEIRRRLEDHLPHYMIPSLFVELAEIPLSPSTGKLNPKLLPDPPTPVTCDTDDIPPIGDAAELERRRVMRLLWERILGLAGGTLGDDADFFDHGGHSLLAVELTLALERIFGVRPRVKDIYEHPTVAALVAYLHRPAEARTVPVSIREDARLDPAVTPGPDRKSPRLRDARAVFLTGATGFLGAFLLEEILRTTPEDLVVRCLVRGRRGDRRDPAGRIADTLKYYRLWRPAYARRIEAVAGDLTRPRFGLSEGEFTDLADRIDLLFHCGSLVNYVYAYPVLKPSVVDGTQEVLRLACTGDLKAVHYISTNGIFIGEEEAPCLENRHIDPYLDRLKGGYERAKWVAEKMVWEAVARGVPVCLYRPGNIGHHSHTGAANPNDFQTMLLDACIRTGCAPAEARWAFEMTPVDFLVSAIVRFADGEGHLGRVYNVVLTETVPARLVFDLLADLGCVSRSVSAAAWKARMAEVSREENAYILSVLAQSLEDLEGYLRDRNVYDCSRFEAALAAHGMARPAIGADYFARLLAGPLFNLPVHLPARRGDGPGSGKTACGDRGRGSSSGAVTTGAGRG